MRLCIIVTAPVTLFSLYRGQFGFLRDHGIDVTGIAAPGIEHEWLRQQGVRTKAIGMRRAPSPFLDLVSLLRLWWYLLWNRFDIVHVSTPKASLLGALAACFSGHGCVILTLRGRAYENLTGVRRWVLQTMDKISCSLATIVVPISRELGNAAVKERVCSVQKVVLVGAGSSNGIDMDRFSRTAERERSAQLLRAEMGIPQDAVVVLFAGRIRREKGVNELVRACAPLLEVYPRLHLLLVGDYEAADPISDDIAGFIDGSRRIHHKRWMQDPAPAFLASDIVAVPSYREGFGNVALEASAAGLPVVATDIIGLREAVAKDVSGMHVPVGDIDALRAALEQLIVDEDLRRRLGRRGAERVQRDFRQEIIWKGLLDLYSRCVPIDRDGCKT